MNKSADYKLTIIVPVYNEEGNILRLEQELASFLKTSRISSCVLFVNDGSTDASENKTNLISFALLLFTKHHGKQDNKSYFIKIIAKV